MSFGALSDGELGLFLSVVFLLCVFAYLFLHHLLKGGLSAGKSRARINWITGIAASTFGGSGLGCFAMALGGAISKDPESVLYIATFTGLGIALLILMVIAIMLWVHE